MGAVSGGRQALRLGGRRGFALRLLGGRPRPVLLLLLRLLPLALRLALLLALAAPAARAAAGGLRRRQVVGQRVRDLLDRAEPLAGCVDQLVGARRVALRRGEQRRPDLARLGERDVDELGRVLLVAVAPRVGERSEQALGLRELRARAAVLHLSRRACEPPRPARQDLLRRVGFLVADRAQQRADALDAVLLPR